MVRGYFGWMEGLRPKPRLITVNNRDDSSYDASKRGNSWQSYAIAGFRTQPLRPISRLIHINVSSSHSAPHGLEISASKVADNLQAPGPLEIPGLRDVVKI